MNTYLAACPAKVLRHALNPWRILGPGTGKLLGILCLIGVTASVGATPPSRDPGDGNQPGARAQKESDLVLIPAGQFWRGDPAGAGMADERPSRLIHLSAFHLSRSEITYGEWHKVWLWAVGHGYQFDNAGRKGWGSSSNDRHPVVLVNWYDSVKWCNARSEMEQRRPAYYEDHQKATVYRQGRLDLKNGLVDWNATGYRLPTEAEWEKAARDGLRGQLFPWPRSGDAYGQEIDPKRANCWPSVRTTREIASYPASTNYGLYDMAGNVWEWCWDRYDPNYYKIPSSGKFDPRGAESGSERVLRGGGWRSVAYLLRCSSRFKYDPAKSRGTFGFRVVRRLPGSFSAAPAAFGTSTTTASVSSLRADDSQPHRLQ